MVSGNESGGGGETVGASCPRTTPPTREDIEAARRHVEEFLPTTPAVRSTYLSEKYDANVFLKREDTMPTGAFKVRGALNVLRSVRESGPDEGVIAASTGNFGLGLAYAGREYDIPVTVAVPNGAPATKVRRMRALSATVKQQGTDYDEAREWVERQSEQSEIRYVHSANEPALVAGFGTAGLEIRSQVPSADFVVCPIGTGAYASGLALALGDSQCEVVGVQATGADAVYRAWETGELRTIDSQETIADGIALRAPFELPLSVLRSQVSNFVCVDDDQIRTALKTVVRHEHVLVEPASATSFAALDELTDQIRGKTVVVPVSGRNTDFETIEALLS